MNQMSFLYSLVESIYQSGESSRLVYGIAILDPISPETILRSIPDLSPDRRAVEALIERCNKLRLAEEQLDDVVADFLAG